MCAWIAGCLAGGLIVVVLISQSAAQESKTSLNPLSVPGSFSGLVKKASPSVVNIRTVQVIEKGGSSSLPFDQDDPMKDFFERFFGGQIPYSFKQQSLGTGFIIDRNGLILTNNHVVEQTDEIKVRLWDDKEFDAKIVGRDSMTDLALIRIEPDRPLAPLPLGNSDRVEVGDWVIAIGNPFGLGNSVTAGIVSAKYRQLGTGVYDNFIQTDTPINPGNSGGPLLNTAGEVIGINTAIFTQSGGSVGIGFAIPVNMVKDLLPQLQKGKVIRGWLGVMMQKITPDLKKKLNLKDEKGALVSDVIAGGPAEKSGIIRGDVIVSFDGKEIKEMHELSYIVASTAVGKKVTLKIIRNGITVSKKVIIEEMEREKESQVAGETTPDLGMVLDEITPELARNFGLSIPRGLLVMQVKPNSIAADADLRPGDIILEIDRTPIKDLKTFAVKLQEYQPGDTMLFLVYRRGNTLYLTMTLGK
ncbi:MAG: DegQ family serine endoprotease [Pseudomonadota bacterium]|uniref:Probable periplasmic serine endoprotease DegP-like n=1 Tax=Candidatus Desulfatibia profunda TaxID=2841695 RepID=A0A8J6NVI3_9BACT|nr:DegQ family serine endoprotease [Candidatus Desulfatibia profunda]MBL7179429.1 DegQ family serine endoprotease [Desulfobacterales bacterium]